MTASHLTATLAANSHTKASSHGVETDAKELPSRPDFFKMCASIYLTYVVLAASLILSD